MNIVKINPIEEWGLDYDLRREGFVDNVRGENSPYEIGESYSIIKELHLSKRSVAMCIEQNDSEHYIWGYYFEPTSKGHKNIEYMTSKEVIEWFRSLIEGGIIIPINGLWERG